MKWVLIYIVINGPMTDIQRVGAFESMTECFRIREDVKASVTNQELFPPGQQAVCIRADVSNLK